MLLHKESLCNYIRNHYIHYLASGFQLLLPRGFIQLRGSPALKARIHYLDYKVIPYIITS